MDALNIALLKAELPKLILVLDKIKEIDPDSEKELTGYVFTDDQIGIKTETWYSGCGTDYNTTWFDLDELGKPFSYFEDKFNKIKLDRQKEEAEIDARQKEAKEREERKEFERLKAKFE